MLREPVAEALWPRNAAGRPFFMLVTSRPQKPLPPGAWALQRTGVGRVWRRCAVRGRGLRGMRAERRGTIGPAKISPEIQRAEDPSGGMQRALEARLMNAEL